MNKAKEEYVKQVKKHIENLQEEVMQLRENKAKLEELKKEIFEFTKKGKGEILAPITDGLFVKAQVADSNTFYVNVGDGVVVEKTAKQANDLMSEQITKTNKVLHSKQQKLSSMYKKVHDDDLFGDM